MGDPSAWVIVLRADSFSVCSMQQRGTSASATRRLRTAAVHSYPASRPRSSGTRCADSRKRPPTCTGGMRCREDCGRRDFAPVGSDGRERDVTLEITADIPDGAPPHVVRAVTENSRTLKLESGGGFEAE